MYYLSGERLLSWLYAALNNRRRTAVFLYQAHGARKYGERVREQIAQQQYRRPSYQSQNNRHAVIQADVADDDADLFTTRSNTSARRYNVSPEQVFTQGNKRLHVRYVDVPPRRSRQPQLPAHQVRDTEDERETQEIVRVRRRVHPLVWVGVTLFIMIFGWITLNFVSAWLQARQDDLVYGQLRHFEINAVVGHNDNVTRPSHFTAENNNGSIFVIELPGGDATKAKIFQITTIPGNEGNPPVQVSFQDINHNGKPVMVVIIGDSNAQLKVILLNNGQTFVSKV